MNRLIPVMLLNNYGFYKTFKYKNKKYLGDPFNIIKILNNKGIDEGAVINIDRKKGALDYGYLTELASEAFFPLSYGGNIDSEEMAYSLIKGGFEKVILNTAFYNDQAMVEKIISTVGAQAVCLNIDYKRNIFGKLCFFEGGRSKNKKLNISDIIEKIQSLSPGEVIFSCIDNEGERKGYDEKILGTLDGITSQIVLNCGAIDHNYVINISKRFKEISFAASSSFFLSPNNKGVLITYPERDNELQ